MTGNCNAEFNESGSQCGHVHHCVKHDHSYIFGSEEDDWHKCKCGKVWR